MDLVHLFLEQTTKNLAFAIFHTTKEEEDSLLTLRTSQVKRRI